MIFSNGLPVGTGLKIQHPTPVDDRMHVATFSDLAAVPYKYNGLACRVADENHRVYVFNLSTNTWNADPLPAPLSIISNKLAIEGISGFKGILNFDLVNGSNKTVTFPNETGTVSYREFFTNSLTSPTANTVTLVNDLASASSSLYYGFNSSGVRGYHSVNSLFTNFEESSTVFTTRTINSWAVKGVPSNISAAIIPKGTGAFVLSVSDGGIIGGNVRGSHAVDLQRTRTAATQVASGQDAFVATRNSTASGSGSAAFNGGVASGTDSFAVGTGIASATNAVSLGGTSSGQRSFTANATNNIASATDSSSFGNQGNISGERSLGVGHFARSTVKNALVIGGSQASTITSLVVTQYSWSLFNAIAGTPYNLVNAQGENLILDSAGAATQTRIVKLTIIGASATVPKGSWMREMLITLDVSNTTHTIADTQVLHAFENNSLVGATISFSVINGSPGQLVMSFTPSTSTAHSVRCFAQWFGCFAPSS
jgi:hypothetical protein